MLIFTYNTHLYVQFWLGLWVCMLFRSHSDRLDKLYFPNPWSFHSTFRSCTHLRPQWEKEPSAQINESIIWSTHRHQLNELTCLNAHKLGRLLMLRAHTSIRLASIGIRQCNCNAQVNHISYVRFQFLRIILPFDLRISTACLSSMILAHGRALYFFFNFHPIQFRCQHFE